MTLRLATVDDVPEFLRMARLFHHTSPYSGIPFSEDRILQYFEIALQNPLSVICILSEQDGDVRGMICGVCDAPPFSDLKVATELAWWMDEEYRHSRDSLDLFKAYEEWARRAGASLCQMALLSSSPDLTKLYERSGYQLTERTFLKEL